MGIMFGYLRGLLYAQGFVPWELKIGAGMHRVYKAQMDVTDVDFRETFEWMVEEYEEDYPGLTVPIDKEDADIMSTVNAREVKHYPEDLPEEISQILDPKKDWTPNELANLILPEKSPESTGSSFGREIEKTVGLGIPDVMTNMASIVKTSEKGSYVLTYYREA